MGGAIYRRVVSPPDSARFTRITCFELPINWLTISMNENEQSQLTGTEFKSRRCGLRYATVCPYIKVEPFIWGRLKRAESAASNLDVPTKFKVDVGTKKSAT